MSSWESITQAVDRVPAGGWLLVAIVAVVGTWRVASRRMRRAGERTAHPELMAGQRSRAKDTALTVASMVPAVLFWAMVLAGSFRGLVSFGRETLHWRDGWEYLVPGSLDGVSVTFALLAFRAVRKQKSPGRSYRVVWGAALASALVNFDYEYAASGHNLVAGGYLALLSLFGMFMFHEFLRQFEEGTDYVARGRPAFGLRWITWPTNTFCAAVAWHNHPPTRGTSATVRNALANLERVRELKRAARGAARQERHERALTQAQRRAELAVARSRDPRRSGNGAATAHLNGHHDGPATATLRQEQMEVAHTPENYPRGGSSSPAMVKVPGTAWRLQKWIDTWMQMVADQDLVYGPINDDQYARATYGASARHLDNVRRAAASGVLRTRAGELGVPLPTGYVDDPGGLNGKTRVLA